MIEKPKILVEGLTQIESFGNIQELELIIEYLEKTEKIFSSMTYDLKNAIELMKLEQL
jgi:hypothetical protein